MTPHRRQPTPPRREDGSLGDNVPEGDESAPEELYLPDESVPYDPGAALVDENQGYTGTGEVYADPNLVYDEHGNAYLNPATGHEDPNGIYDESGQVYGDPAPAAIDPMTGYDGAAGEYPDPNQSSGYPEPGLASGGVYDDAPESSYQAPPPPVRRPVKKKVVSRAPQRRPSTPPRKIPGGGYQRPAPTYASGGGISFMTVLLTLVALAMLGIVAMVVLPRDMSTVAAYPTNPITSGKPRNLLEEAQKMMISRTADLTFTEEEVNQYLNHRLQGEQTGPMAALVKFRGVYIDFTPGMADIILERELFGLPLTTSATITTGKFRQQTIYSATNWHFGRINLGKNTIKPVLDLFLRLRSSCHDEFQTLQQMVDVKFEDNLVVLDATL